MATVESPPVASVEYRGPIRFALLQQVPTAILCLLMLDGGYAAKICGCAMAGFWIGTIGLLARRPFHPDSTDLRFIRWGFFPILAASGILAALWSGWANHP